MVSISLLVGLGWGLRICISTKSQVTLNDAAGPGPLFEKMLLEPSCALAASQELWGFFVCLFYFLFFNAKVRALPRLCESESR